MQFCGGDPILFGFFSAGILLLLIGGGLWGSGESDGNKPKEIAGIVITGFGALSTVVGISFLTWKTYKESAKKKKLESDINRFQSDYVKNEERRTSSIRIPSQSGKNNGWVNPAHSFIPEEDTRPNLSRSDNNSSRSNGRSDNEIEMSQIESRSAVPNKTIPMPGKVDSPTNKINNNEKERKSINESSPHKENNFNYNIGDSLYSEGETLPDCMDGSKCDFVTSKKLKSVNSQGLSFEEVDLNASNSYKDKKVPAEIWLKSDMLVVKL